MQWVYLYTLQRSKLNISYLFDLISKFQHQYPELCSQYVQQETPNLIPINFYVVEENSEKIPTSTKFRKRTYSSFE